MASILTALGEGIAAGAGFLYGCMYLSAALLYAAFQREWWLSPSGDAKALLAKASRELWSLTEGSEDLSHNFVTVKDGTQLHYLSPRRSQTSNSDNSGSLIVFLHGFPDSGHLFARQLRSDWASKAKLVALDLPGCGGSDSIPYYGPDDVLNLIAEAITLLKQRYLGQRETPTTRAGSKSRCILVGHDWGGVIAFRLAAETKGLLDRVVTLNSLYPVYAEEQLRGRISRGNQLISKYSVGAAGNELGPVFSQLGRSSYTYMLTLPIPLAKILPRLTLCLLKYAHSIQYNQFPKCSPDEAATRLAMAFGPSSVESAPSKAADPGYGPSVFARSKTSPPGDWDQRVRLYAQGLLRDKWTPSFLGLPEPTPREPLSSEDVLRFKCPVNIIFGLQDIALDPRIVLDGIEKYFVKENTTPEADKKRIVRLPNCGHWSILEEEGVKALNEVLGSLLTTT